MAVGIPKRLRPVDFKQIDNCHLSGNFSLTYPGKKSPIEILATPAGSYNTQQGTMGNNRLYHADNLGVLAALAQDNSILGKVKLVYIDPPFATDAAFESRTQQHAYHDDLTGSTFVEALRERLILIHRLLANDGSLYLHLDGRMVFHMKLIMDEIFGEQNFRNCIARKKCNPKNYTRKTYGNITDYILFYSKTEHYVWNRALEPWDETRAMKEYPCIDEQGRRYKKVPIHAPGVRHGETGKSWRGMLPPPGKHWQYTPSKLEEFDKQGDIYWSPTGNPRRKVYFTDSSGIPVQDMWLDMKDAHNQNIHVTGYPTEKNLDMLERIIAASSNQGDLVLDCYAGSGTTLAAASNLGRKWIGVDQSNEAIKTILQRFTNGTERMGDFVNKPNQPKNLPLFPTPNDTDFVLFMEKI